MTAGPIRAGELVQAASMAVAQLGGLGCHIESVELSFEKPALADMIWPSFIVTVKVPDATQRLVIRRTVSVSVRSAGPFPTDEFIRAMVAEVRSELARQIEQLRGSITRIEESLVLPSQAEVA